MSRLKVLFYGDDFTGSSENLAQYHRSGARAKLYLVPPSAETLSADCGSFDVLGLAGTARALAPAEMREELETSFASLAAEHCNLVQYKICSTFDSAPSVGSFGIAFDVAEAYFGRRNISVLAATPDFGRYTCFGNHFARFGGEVMRLDRHPSMCAHPRTPMKEADLKAHLAVQTERVFQNITVAQLHQAGLSGKMAEAFAAGDGVILDGVYNSDMEIGVRALWEVSRQAPMFSLSAQGLAQHLGYLWAKLGLVPGPATVRTAIAAVERLLVLSGSCALQNGRQIEAAEAAGWLSLRLDPADLSEDGAAKAAAERIAQSTLAALATGRSVIIYSAKGLDGRHEGSDVPADRLGLVYAGLMRRARSEAGLARVVLAGGDSSSYAVRHSGAQSLEIAVFDHDQNSHVCRLSAPGITGVDGLEVMLKGGQVGHDDYFLRAKAGTATISKMPEASN